MENCVAPGLDEFDVIIRSCIVFSQSNNTYTHSLSHTRIDVGAASEQGSGQQWVSSNFEMACDSPIIMSIPRYWKLPVPVFRWWKKSQMGLCMCKEHLSYLQTAMAQVSPYIRLHSLRCPHTQYMIKIRRSSPTSWLRMCVQSTLRSL